MKLQVESSHYFKNSYDTKKRFISYWYQINEMLLLKPKSILEVGIGNGFVFNYLRCRKFNIITLDIDERLKPICVGYILNMPFPHSSFELVACFELLEHLPYKNVQKALEEIYRVTKKYAILSLPDCSRVYNLYIHLPKIGIFKKLIPIPRLKTSIHKFNGEHYWEIGKSGYPLNKIISDIKKVGFNVKNTYRVFENPFHRFFVLKKASRKYFF